MEIITAVIIAVIVKLAPWVMKRGARSGSGRSVHIVSHDSCYSVCREVCGIDREGMPMLMMQMRGRVDVDRYLLMTVKDDERGERGMER